MQAFCTSAPHRAVVPCDSTAFLFSLAYGPFAACRKLVTGSIVHSAKRRYLSYSEADFEVSRPAGSTRCIDGGEIWQGGVEEWTFCPLLHAEIYWCSGIDDMSSCGVQKRQLQLL